MAKYIYSIPLLALFAIPFLIGSCDSDDYVIDANGINADSTSIFVLATGAVNYLNVTTFKNWWIETENVTGVDWLTVTPDEGNYSSRVNFTATVNDRRRRSMKVLFVNEYMADTVVVIQRAPADYEPGRILYYETFGDDSITRVNIATYNGSGASGSGISAGTYSGAGAYRQSYVRSRDYLNQPHEELSGFNSLLLEAGGYIQFPRLQKLDFEKVILTVYAASYDGGIYVPMERDALYIEGSTDGFEYQTIVPWSAVTNHTGWQKIEYQFTILAAASNFHLRMGNSGNQTIYVDDLTLEAGGRGTAEIGVPTPTVKTNAAGDITEYSALIAGEYELPAQISSVETAGFEWWREGQTEESYTSVEIAGTVPGEEFTHELNGLEPGTIYFFRAFTVHDGTKTTYGTEESFKTHEADSGRRR